MRKDGQYQYVTSHLNSYLGSIKNYRVEIYDQQWRYLDGGEGEVVIFLHGLCGSKTQWRSLMRHLIKGYRVISIDVPGLYLEQGLENRKNNLREFALWFDVFLAKLGVRRCHLVGHSMGCTMAAYYAATRRSVVASLTLLSFPDVLLPGDSGRIELWDRFKESIYFKTVEDMDNYFQDIYYKLPSIPGVIKKFSYQNFKRHEDRYLVILDELAATMPLILTLLGRIQCPVLSVTGEYDGWSSERLQQEINTHIPICEHVHLDNCGHMCFFERPIAVRTLCAVFLDKASLSQNKQNERVVSS